ncbi:MAG: DUF1905 domain-containing protein [Ignavibacteriaceae bacterium]|jgi:hypothetical protein|nr:DUF1905 domain-containing protein [Ignavibacteriaceae bacterium]
MTIHRSTQNGATLKATYRVRAKVWLYQGFGGWHFMNISTKQSSMIRTLYGIEARPFGSIPVSVTIGKTQWKTSLFPDKKSKSYLLAIKADVRRKEHIASGDTIIAQVQIL